MTRQLNLPLHLSGSVSFDNFFASGNEEVLAAVQALSRQERPSPVLFLHGPAGSGKSHLLQALSRLAIDAQRLAVYAPVGATGVGPELVAQLNADTVVCVDDLDRIVGDQAWEESLLELYERLAGGRGALVAAALQPPAGLGLKLADLSTRLVAGGAYRLRPLSDDMLPAAMRLRASVQGYELPDSVSRYLVRRTPRNSAVLFRILDRIDQAALSRQRRITVPFIKELEKEVSYSDD